MRQTHFFGDALERSAFLLVESTRGIGCKCTYRHFVDDEIFLINALSLVIVSPVVRLRFEIKCPQKLTPHLSHPEKGELVCTGSRVLTHLMLKSLAVISDAEFFPGGDKRGIRVKQNAILLPAIPCLPSSITHHSIPIEDSRFREILHFHMPIVRCPILLSI